MRGFLAAACVIALTASGCEWGASAEIAADPSIGIAADPPPSPKTWPRYPWSWPDSCWGRDVGGGVMRAAPSYAPDIVKRAVSPAQVVDRLLRRFGDRRFIRAIRLGPPPRNRLRFAIPEAPEGALWAYISAPAATEHGRSVTPEQAGRHMVAQWEAELVGGALRDDLCAAGGAPLVGWTFGPALGGMSDGNSAFGQRFPNPSTRAFRERLALVGRKYGFRVLSLRLLRPRQLAPSVVVETDRDRKDFVRDIPAIRRLLDPFQRGAATFEGFFLEARDADGPFVRVANVFRGHWMGSQWSWDPCVYPYEHLSRPFGRKPCP